MGHRLDAELKLLDSELAMCELEEDKAAIQAQIASREDFLKPVYLQAATEFADLHDKTGRMKAKGVIREAVAWESSREFFYWRAKRRMLEDEFVDQLCAASPALGKDGAVGVLQGMLDGDYEDDKAVASFMESNTDNLADKVKSTKAAGVQSQIEALQKELEGLDFQ